jgi:hypothetical protein
VLLFLATTLVDPRIAKLWVEPWTTTMSAAAIWLSLGIVADHLFGARLTAKRAALLGLLLMLIPLVRPADLAVSAVIAPFALWRMPLRSIAAMVGAGAALLAGFAALHLSIYGARWSDYVMLSREYGLNFADLTWKSYVLLVDPAQWFPGETGLLREMPWLLLGAAGLIVGLAVLRGPARALWLCLGSAALAYCLVLFAYVDLLPSGMWRYNNVHYFKWLLPMLALATLLFVRWVRQRPGLAGGVVAALLLLTCVRPEPVAVGADEPARALRFSTPPTPWTQIYMARSAISSRIKVQRNFFDYHQIPDGETQMIAVALKRPFIGQSFWVADAHLRLPIGAPGHDLHDIQPVRSPALERLGTRWAISTPCWLVRCA